MLNGVFDFINNHKKDYNPKYKVFKEQFVLCWAGKKIIHKGKEFFTTVDIELNKRTGSSIFFFFR